MRNGYGKRRSLSGLIGSVALGTWEPTRVCAKTESAARAAAEYAGEPSGGDKSGDALLWTKQSD
jgi:hypothetical protein